MKKLFVLTLLSCCASLLPSTAADLPSRDQVVQMVYHERFDQLEKLIGGLRGQKQEFYQGGSQLADIYGDLSGFSDETDDAQWKLFITKLESWAEAYPQSPAPLVALGNVYVGWAWKARGSGYGNTVSSEGWTAMRARLDMARQNLEAAEQLPVKDPELYEALLSVALGQGWSRDKMNDAFQKGIAIDPNDLQLYESKAYFLLPRWYGLRGEWEAFAAEAADARGGDDGDILYMCIARSQADTEGGDFFKHTRISYPRMQRGFEASLRRNPGYLSDMNYYCYFACIAGDRTTAQKMFKQIDGQWESEVWGNEDYFKQWQQWASFGSYSSSSSDATIFTLPLLKNLKPIIMIVAAVWLVAVTVMGVFLWHVLRKPK